LSTSSSRSQKKKNAFRFFFKRMCLNRH
jgi:hypothetical protein